MLKIVANSGLSKARWISYYTNKSLWAFFELWKFFDFFSKYFNLLCKHSGFCIYKRFFPFSVFVVWVDLIVLAAFVLFLALVTMVAQDSSRSGIVFISAWVFLLRYSYCHTNFCILTFFLGLFKRMFPRHQLVCDKGKLMERVVFCWEYNHYFCLQTNKSKQSYIWIKSRFEAENICVVAK